MSWIVAGSIAVGSGLLKGYQTGQAVNAQADQLERDRQNLLRQMEQTREQGRREKGLAHQSAMQSQIFGDYEEDRIRRIQEFKTSQKMAGMGGRGASLGKNAGTPYNVILSQKAEDTTNINLHKFKVDTTVKNKKDAGQRAKDALDQQADNLYQQAEAKYYSKLRLQNKKQEMMFTSFLTGGMQGLSSGIQVAGAMRSFKSPSTSPSTSPYANDQYAGYSNYRGY